MYQTKSQKNYLWIFFTMFSVGLGQSLVFTSIPILARENGLNEVQVSIIFWILGICMVFYLSFVGEVQRKVWNKNYSYSRFIRIFGKHDFDRVAHRAIRKWIFSQLGIISSSNCQQIDLWLIRIGNKASFIWLRRQDLVREEQSNCIFKS